MQLQRVAQENLLCVENPMPMCAIDQNEPNFRENNKRKKLKNKTKIPKINKKLRKLQVFLGARGTWVWSDLILFFATLARVVSRWFRLIRFCFNSAPLDIPYKIRNQHFHMKHMFSENLKKNLHCLGPPIDPSPIGPVRGFVCGYMLVPE